MTASFELEGDIARATRLTLSTKRWECGFHAEQRERSRVRDW